MVNEKQDSSQITNFLFHLTNSLCGMTMRIGKLHLQRVHKKVCITAITPLESQRVVGCSDKLNGGRRGWVGPRGHFVHCTQTSRTNTVDGLNAYSGDKRYVRD